MIDRFQRKIYDKYWFLFHTLFSIVICIIILGLLALLHIDINNLKKIVNNDTVSIITELAGFVFAGMSIFISLDGNKKMQTIKKIGKDNIIYYILISSIVFLVFSVVFMLVDINVFNINSAAMSIRQAIAKNVIQWLSLYCLLSGVLYFISSLQIIVWIFKK